jgi:hypothetical protein
MQRGIKAQCKQTFSELADFFTYNSQKLKQLVQRYSKRCRQEFKAQRDFLPLIFPWTSHSTHLILERFKNLTFSSNSYARYCAAVYDKESTLPVSLISGSCNSLIVYERSTFLHKRLSKFFVSVICFSSCRLQSGVYAPHINSIAGSHCGSLPISLTAGSRCHKQEAGVLSG